MLVACLSQGDTLALVVAEGRGSPVIFALPTKSRDAGTSLGKREQIKAQVSVIIPVLGKSRFS